MWSNWREQAILLYMMITMTIVTWDYLIYRINLAKYPKSCMVIVCGKCVFAKRESVCVCECVHVCVCVCKRMWG